MARDSDLIEEAVELADDGGDLLGQVAGVHDCGTCQRRWKMFNGTCTVDRSGEWPKRGMWVRGSRFAARRHDRRPVARKGRKKKRGK
jgi:hypothetical protein